MGSILSRRFDLLAEIIRIGKKKGLPQMKMLLTGIAKVEELAGISVREFLHFLLDTKPDSHHNPIRYS